jgi:hypothetical protein
VSTGRAAAQCASVIRRKSHGPSAPEQSCMSRMPRAERTSAGRLGRVAEGEYHAMQGPEIWEPESYRMDTLRTRRAWMCATYAPLNSAQIKQVHTVSSLTWLSAFTSFVRSLSLQRLSAASVGLIFFLCRALAVGMGVTPAAPTLTARWIVIRECHPARGDPRGPLSTCREGKDRFSTKAHLVTMQTPMGRSSRCGHGRRSRKMLKPGCSIRTLWKQTRIG